MMLLLAVFLGLLAADWHVDGTAGDCAGATGGPLDPFCTIAEAIAVAANGDRILIAPGTYEENLVLAQDVELVGTGGRDVTIVDGGGMGSVVVQQEGTVVSLRELTLTNGLAARGGGIDMRGKRSSRLTLTNTTVRGNTAHDMLPPEYSFGGGLATSEGSVVEIVGSSFGNNIALSYYCPYEGFSFGGAIYNLGAATIVSSSFYGNVALNVPYSFELGNAVSNSGEMTITSSLFASNGSLLSDGGTIVNFTSLTITNTTLADDIAAGSVSGLFGSDSVVLKDSIVWNFGTPPISGTATVTHCVVEGGFPGEGNIALDPLFDDSANADYRLQPGSPCIDAGNPLSRPTGVDFDGNVRRLDGDLDGVVAVDMGAHEFTNVRLTASGTTWQDLTIGLSGTPGLGLFLAAGRRPGESPLPPWGRTLFALDSLWFAVPFGAIPVVARFGVPRDASVIGGDVILQGLALGVPLGGARPGNLSNAIRLSLD